MNAPDLAEDDEGPSAPKIPEEFQIIEASQSRELFRGLLEIYYLPLEIWYTRSIIDKVIPPFARRLGNSNPV